MGIPSAVGSDGVGGNSGGRDLCIPPSEHGCTFYCDQAHYGPMYGSRAATGAKDFQAGVVTGRGGFGGNVDGGSGGGTDGGEGRI